MNLKDKRKLVIDTKSKLVKAVPTAYRAAITRKINAVVKNANTKEYGLFYAVVQVINTAYKFPFEEGSDYDVDVHTETQTKILKAFNLEAFDLDCFDVARGYHTFINKDDGEIIEGIKPITSDLKEITEYIATVLKVKGDVLSYDEDAWQRAEDAILQELDDDAKLLEELTAA